MQKLLIDALSSRTHKDYDYDILNFQIDDLNIDKVIPDHPTFEEHRLDISEPE